MKAADILITDEVLYENNDEGRYCCMTLDQFCDMGLRVARGFGLSKGCTEEDLLSRKSAVPFNWTIRNFFTGMQENLT